MSPERRREGDDLTGRRQGYSQLQGELHHFFRRIWAIVIIIGLTSTLGLVGYGFALAEIQDQRREACIGQNARHDAAARALKIASDRDIENAKKNLPTSQGQIAVEEIENRRDVTLGLIDALQPKLDCSKVVETGVGAYLPW